MKTIDYIPITVCFAALRKLTPEAREGLAKFAEDHDASNISIITDQFPTDNLTFSIWHGGEVGMAGLVEPDGRIHT